MSDRIEGSAGGRPRRGIGTAVLLLVGITLIALVGRRLGWFWGAAPEGIAAGAPQEMPPMPLTGIFTLGSLVTAETRLSAIGFTAGPQ